MATTDDAGAGPALDAATNQTVTVLPPIGGNAYLGPCAICGAPGTVVEMWAPGHFGRSWCDEHAPKPEPAVVDRLRADLAGGVTLIVNVPELPSGEGDAVT